MSVMAQLVLSLALASLGRATDGADSLTGLPRSGRAFALAKEERVVAVDTEDGVVLLVLASDAMLRGLDGPIGLGDIRPGDTVEWIAGELQRVAMVDDLKVMSRPLGERR